MGTVYLIHFEAAVGHARHYLGYTDRALEERLGEHRAGRGARLMAVVVAAGIGFHVTRTWSGARALEQRLKNLGSAARLCPDCTPGTRWGKFDVAPKSSRWVTTRGKQRRYLFKSRTRGPRATAP